MPDQSVSNTSSDELWNAAVDWVLALHEQPDNAALRAALAQWLGDDDARHRAFREAGELWGFTGQLDPAYTHLWENPPQSLTPATAPAIETSSPSTISPPRRAPRYLRSGAALAACLALALPLWYARFDADFHVAPGQTRQLVLEDRSEVLLNSDSALDVDYSAAMRLVTLHGEAFFAVTANRARPFVVRAGNARVRVLGTHFNVRHRDGELSVEVEEGHVYVTDPKHGVEQELFAGDTVSVDGATVRRDHVPPQRVAAWRRGQLIVDGWTVRKLVDEMGYRRRGVTIITDRRLAAERVSGVFDVTRPDDALHAAMQPVGGVVREYGPYLTLVSAR